MFRKLKILNPALWTHSFFISHNSVRSLFPEVHWPQTNQNSPGPSYLFFVGHENFDKSGKTSNVFPVFCDVEGRQVPIMFFLLSAYGSNFWLGFPIGIVWCERLFEWTVRDRLGLIERFWIEKTLNGRIGTRKFLVGMFRMKK